MQNNFKLVGWVMLLIHAPTYKKAGFTLIEVLLALAVIAIALTAMLKVSAQNIENTQRIKDKTISHWVAMQGVSLVQLKLAQISTAQESTFSMNCFKQKWYWRVKVDTTPLKNVQQLTISTSQSQAGPFYQEVIAYRYLT